MKEKVKDTKMIHMSKKIRLTVIAIAVYSIIQTCFHFFWVVYTYLLTVCQIKPVYYDVAFVYLTYFYRQSCGAIDVTNEAYFLNTTSPDDGAFYDNGTASEALYHFVKATVQIGRLPEQSNAASRTDMYLYLFLYTDVTWVVSSIFLFGSYFEKKQKFMSILFYGPWMLVCVFVCFLDVIASVHFGVDMIYIHSYTTWLKFVGISNYADFESFNDYPISKLVFAMPSSIIVFVLSRIFFVWLINVICFFFILFLAIPDIFFRDIVRPSASRSRKSVESKLQFDTGEELDLNSSEARIRNWQLFYGAIEANSTMASSSPNSSGPSNSTDHNSNSRSSEGDNKVNKKQFETHYEKNTRHQEPSTISSVDSGFRRYSDVAYDVSALPAVATTNVKMQVLRGQLPWSYMSPDGHLFKKNHTYNKNPTQRTLKIRDSVTDSTRL